MKCKFKQPGQLALGPLRSSPHGGYLFVWKRFLEPYHPLLIYQKIKKKLAESFNIHLYTYW